MNKIGEFLLGVLGFFGLASVGVFAVLGCAAILAIIPMKIYGLYLLVCLFTGSLKFGDMLWYQALAIILIILPFRVVVKEKRK